MTTAVEFRRLTFAFGQGPTILSDLTLSIRGGERIAIVGPNGAGKSTLLWHLNGLLPEALPAVPQVFVNGVAIAKSSLHLIRRQVGLLFQNPDDQLFCPTVGEDVGFALEQHGRPSEEISAKTATALAAVGLQGFEARPPGELSLGEKKRACLAGLLASEPSILALDEPTASLDPRARRGVINLFDRMSQTMIVATHDLALAREACHRMIILDEGVIRADGTPGDILNDLPLLRRHGLDA